MLTPPTNRLELHVASGDPLDVRRFEITEGMNELFRVTVRAVSRSLDVDFDAILGLDASLAVGTLTSTKTWRGVCVEADQVRVDREGLATYELVLAPRAHRMTLRKNYRIFQYQSELDIVVALLGEWGIPHRVAVDGAAHKPRKFRVQYGETDFTFLSRMLEDAGISFYFEDDGGETMLVLDDAPHAGAPAAPPLRFFDSPGVADVDFATRVEVVQRVRPGKITVGDLDYRRASTNQPRLSASGGLAQEAALEQFHYEPGAFLYQGAGGGSTPTADDRGAARTDESSGARKVDAHLRGHRADGRRVRLESNVLTLAPGAVCSLLSHPHHGAGGALLVVQTRLAGEHSSDWRVQLEAAPTSDPYRPQRRTPKPKVAGLEGRLRPGGQAIGDLDYRRQPTRQPRLSTRAGLPQEAALEQFDFEPGAFLFEAAGGGNSPTADDRGAARTDEATGAGKVEARLHGARSDARVVELTSDVLGLAPGRILATMDHPHRLLAAPLLVTATSLAGEQSTQWRVRALTVPTTSPHRPGRKTPRPVAHGLESATVVGPAGEEIHTDEFGRVRVHFHWDRESGRDAKSSCWLPTNQPWAGQGYGGVNLPRIGQEVLVEFLGADPDRPVVIGRVYTATNPVPDPLPKYKHVAGLFSESTPRMVMGGAGPGGAGANQSIFGGTPMTPAEMASNATASGPLQVVSPTGTNHTWQGSGFKLDDMSGAENAYIQANRDMHWVVHNNWTTVVGAHRTALIGTDEITHIDKDQKIYVGSDQTTIVQKNQGNRIVGKRTDSVGEKFTLFAAEGIKLASVDDTIRINADDSIKFDSETTIELRVKNSLIKLQGNMISAGSGGDQVHINPTRQADSPDPPPDQATIDRGVAALDQYRQSLMGQRHPPSPNSGENAFARQAMRDAGISDRAAQDAALQQYWSRPSSGSIDLR